MLCDTCQKNDATIFLTQVVEGQTTKAALCVTCGEPFTKGAISPEQLLGLLRGAGQDGSPFLDPFSEIAGRDPRYTKEAFWFVRDGVHRAASASSPPSHHVTAGELLESLRSLALERFGITAREQLRSWGVTRCEDFGEIVFTLIEHEVFGKKPEDKKEDFSNGYDFASTFPAATQ